MWDVTKCTSMAREMETKDKVKAAVVDRLLLGANTPFTRRVANYHLPEKFKVPHIQSCIGVVDAI
jgi:hypothetical protein